MKRANGTGSVYKLSGKRNKPWIAVIFIDENGEQTRKPLGTFATKPDAERAISQNDLSPLSVNSGFTLLQVFNTWNQTKDYTSLSVQTKNNYSAAFLHMEKYHNYKFGVIKKSHWQDIVDTAEERGETNTLIRKARAKKNNKNKRYKLTDEQIKIKIKELNLIPKGLGLSSLEKIKALAGLLSEYAFSEDIVNKMYYKSIRLPSEDKSKKVETFNDIERAIMFKNDENDIIKTALILIYTGMRITELLTLSKFHVDIKNMVIIGGVKTDAGKDRVIPIHHKIQKYIKYFYDRSEQFLIEYDKQIGNVKKGTKKTVHMKYRYEYYRDLYDAELERLEIRKLTPHKARHTFFTEMDDKCEDDWAMAVVGGHTDPNFSKKKYSHPDIERLRRAVESIE